MKRDNIPLAIGLMFISTVSATIMVALVKINTNQIPTSIMLFARFLVSFILICLIVSFQKMKQRAFSLKAKRPVVQIMRTFFGMASLGCYFLAVQHIPLANASLLYATSPLFAPIIVSVLLKIKTPASVWVFLLLGFIGVLVVLQPRVSSFVNKGSIYGLLSGLTAAFSFYLSRQITRDDTPLCLLFYYYLYGCLGFALLSIASWRCFSWHDITYLLAIGVAGTLYQSSVTYALNYAPSRLITSLFNMGIIFSAIADYLYWGKLPNTETYLGAALIIFACTMVSYLFVNQSNKS